MYKIEYQKNSDHRKPVLASIRLINKAESAKTIAYLKSATKKSRQPDSFNGGTFWVSNLIINGRKQ